MKVINVDSNLQRCKKRVRNNNNNERIATKPCLVPSSDLQVEADITLVVAQKCL